MTAISWTGAAGDHLFTMAANWSTDTVPGAGDDVSIGAGVGVQDTAATTVNSIVLGVGTIFEVSNSFTATNGSGAATSRGTFFVDNGQSLSIGGAFNNAGIVSLNSNGATTTLGLLGSTTLSGGGSIVLGANANNAISYTGATSGTLTNNETISGIGSIGSTGAGQFAIVNGSNGVIDATATVAGTLSINANGGVTNMGLMESSAKGVLSISNTTISNAGGTIENASLTNSSVLGGTISNLALNGTGAVDGGGLDGPVTVASNSSLILAGVATIEGEIDNLGEINADQTTTISGPVTLKGNGTFIGKITGLTGVSTDTLTNVSDRLELTAVSNVTFINNGVIVPNFAVSLSINNSNFTNNSGGEILNCGISGNSTVVNNGVIELAGNLVSGYPISAPVIGSGTLIVENAVSNNVRAGMQNANGIVNITSNFQNDITFENVDGYYGGQEIELAQAYTGTISGFTLNDLINLTSIPYSALNHVVWHSNASGGGTLSIENLVGGVLASLNFSDSNTGRDFTVSSDSSGYTLITGVKTAASANDLFANGLSTALWQSSSGQTAIWRIGINNTGNGSPSGAIGNYLPTLNATSNIIGAGDFNGDGYDDVLVQDSATGILTQWFMNGATVTSQSTLPDPGPTWSAKALGDFNDDGVADIAFQNVDGSVAVWDMNGSTIQAAAVVANPGTSWHLDATGDFDGNGGSELLFQKDDGSIATWEMNGVSLVSGADLPNPDPTWHVKGTGDFNGDGRSDILFQNNDGSVAIWEMSNSSTLLAAAIIGNPGSNWQVGGIGDYTGSGMSDILLQNSSTGAVNVWIMNGLTLSQQVSLSSNPGTSWHSIV